MSNSSMVPRWPPASSGGGGGDRDFVTRQELYQLVNQLAGAISERLDDIKGALDTSANLLRDQNGKLGAAITDVAVLKAQIHGVEELKSAINAIQDEGCRTGKAVHAAAGLDGWGQKKTAAVSGVSGAAIMTGLIKLVEWLGGK